MNEASLFEGELIRLAPFDPEKDAEVESRWTHDAEYLRLLEDAPARPLSPGQVKKKHEGQDKDEQRSFHFSVRRRADDRLVGFVRLQWIEWSHGASTLRLGIGAPEDRGKGYGREALRLILRYAFEELNLHRVGTYTFEYNPRAAEFLQKAGFQIEVRRRQAVNRDGRRWDTLILGLLRPEWEQTVRSRKSQVQSQA